MEHARKSGRFGMSAKLNLLLIVGILLISIGLMQITYLIYKRKVDSLYFERATSAAKDVVNEHLAYQLTSYLRERIDTDEFREVRARAASVNDEKIIEDWMRAQPPTPYLAEYYAKNESTIKYKERYTLFGDYQELKDELTEAMHAQGIDKISLQYIVDGVTYSLVEPGESLLLIGTAKEPIDALTQYGINDAIPPTIYQYGGNWLCTASEPFVEEWEDKQWTPAQVYVDIDMRNVAKDRRWFLVNSAMYITVFTLLAMAVSMLLTWKLATKSLKQLTEAATGFAMEEDFSRENVIELPIRSNDEIGDLYHEIRFMQERIIDSTGRLTRITAEREQIRTELKMAASIQSSVLPSQFPAFPNRPEFDLYASMEPAKDVGGDFYDFFLVDDEHLALVIADVSDKGVPAALFMMSAKNTINYRTRMGGTPGEILTSVNAQLLEDNKMKMFVTVWLGILELPTGRLTCANAGHEYPILRRPGEAFQLLTDHHDVMMGVIGKAAYQDYTLDLEPGSRLFLYTDGLAEANNEQEEQFDTVRILQALNAHPDGSPRELLENVRGSVNRFTGDAMQYDDLTMLCLEYRGSSDI